MGERPSETSTNGEEEEVEEQKNTPKFTDEGEFVHEGRNSMNSGCLDSQVSQEARIDERIFKIPNQVGFSGKRHIRRDAYMVLWIVPVLTH